MTEKVKKPRISGKEATHVAIEAQKFGPIQIRESGDATPTDEAPDISILRQSQRHMTEEYITVYGNYANRLLRLQLDLIHALDRHRRGHKQTVEVRHVHIHSGAQGVVGIVNPPEKTYEATRGEN
jgi:hypothetical protein